jgi:hypothetical protein
MGLQQQGLDGIPWISMLTLEAICNEKGIERPCGNQKPDFFKHQQQQQQHQQQQQQQKHGDQLPTKKVLQI